MHCIIFVQSAFHFGDAFYLLLSQLVKKLSVSSEGFSEPLEVSGNFPTAMRGGVMWVGL